MSPQDAVHLRGLHIRAQRRDLVQGVGLTLRPGKITMLVGASGSGKSLTARALLGMVSGVHPGLVHAELEVHHQGATLRPYESGDFGPVRGPILGWLPQDARASLAPLSQVGAQLSACLSLSAQGGQVGPILERVGLLPSVQKRYPHELSGGMAQRVGVALALARGSRYLVVDEPTTGLDPSVRRGILSELRELKEQGVGMLFITHDLRLVPELGDHLLVMHQGRIVEDTTACSLDALRSPQAQALWQATARIAQGRR